jgi:glutamate transport system permease protein
MAFFGQRYAFSFFLVVLAIYLTMNLLLSWVARIISRRTGSKSGGLTAAKEPPVKPLDPEVIYPAALGNQMGKQMGGGV